ncbi:cell division protein FtsZ [Mesonia mobilis]|uniref:Cell division protein FtsZ n=1 Tax=Mesonia mobilis TaxID=369791 RepID=A0ABQ3BQP6_9FLAO|nr:cell division protein FtsZ [Mesonia mobilis]MBQ0736846.1 cell division protein FtsZ [Aquimarina celericrescens]GGZ53997.1 cell division protein FtsZ [Mesonia mobilis]
MSSTEFDISFDLPKNQSNVIKVIGVGGGGSNAINHMFHQGINGVDFVVCNTDAQALENSPVPIKVQLGVSLTEGLGAGANPEIGEKAALESFDDLKTLLDKNTKMVFITAGMGGGTGTGAAPIIAKQAKDMDILTVGIVTIPFQFEGKMRNEQAQLGVEKLRKNVDSLIVINNNKLRDVYGNLGFKAGFSKADEVLATASRGIAEVITHHYTQNIDLRDAKTVLSNSGTAIMGSATASGSNRAQEAIAKALDSPLLNDNKISGAKNVLLLIVSGSEEITIDEIGEINDHIQGEAGHSANIIMGVGDDESLEESISVTIIATGFDLEQQNVIVNTETKKIIHTLEDEQKAVHNLTPGQTTPRQTAPQERKAPEQNRIVHTLEDEVEEKPAPKREEPKNEMNLVPTSELIKNIEVSYEDISYNEDDFVIIDADQEAKEVEVNEPEEISAQTEEDEQPTMFTFDFPLNEEKVEEKIEETPSATKNEVEEPDHKVYFSLEEEEVEEDVKNIEVNSGIEVISAEQNANGEKRYSLEDYMELEERIENAKPQATSTPQPQKPTQPEPKAEEFKVERREVKQEEKQAPQQPASGEIDPFENPISEDLIARAAERRARMKNFNYKFRNNNNIDEIEKQPAYKRAGLDLNNEGSATNDKISRTSLGTDSNDEITLRTNNSFLHDNVD